MSKNVPENTFDRLKPYAVLCFAPADRAFAEADASALTAEGCNVYLNTGDRKADTAAVEDKNCRLILFYLSAAGVSDLGCSVLMGARSSLFARQAHGERAVPFAVAETVPAGDLPAFVRAEEDRVDSTVAASPEEQKKLDDASRALIRFEQILYNAGREPERVPAERGQARENALRALLKDSGVGAASGAPGAKTAAVAGAPGEPADLETGLAALNEKRYEEALKAFRRAAFKKDPLGMFHLGRCYENGWGTERDEKLAAQYYKKAADAGLAEAQIRYGVCCEEGKGVPQDLDQAERYYTLAGEQGSDDALERLDGLMKKRSGSPDPAPAAVPAAPKAPVSAALEAQYEKAYALYQKRQYAEALRLFKPGAEQGHAGSQYYVGLCFYFGRGVSKDAFTAANWYRKAADQGNLSAIYNLGCCYRDGIGVARDYAEAAKLFRRAAEQGHASAQCSLGLLYEKGNGVAKDLAEAVGRTGACDRAA